MSIPNNMTVIEVTVRDPDNEFLKLIEYIKSLAAPGHSFDVMVDPDMRENKQSFNMDGDGSFFIKQIKQNNKLVKFKDGKLVENYLRSL